MTFAHYFMTRFNMATPGREFAIRTQPGWLDYRFDLFERFCAPSLAAQTDGNFRWIIYFDEATPAPHRDRIETLRKKFGFHPFYTGLFAAEGWTRSLRETFAPGTDRVLTTRLDSDDALAEDFVARLHAAVAAAGERPGGYNFTEGLIRRADALYAIRHPSNAFFSWLSPNGPELRTAPSIHHMTIASEGPVVQIGGDPVWMQIVHESNVSNRVRGRRVSPARAGRRFHGAAVAGLADPPAAAIALDNMFVAPLRLARDRLIETLRPPRQR